MELIMKRNRLENGINMTLNKLEKSQTDSLISLRMPEMRC
jgi:hypothetical protein